MTTDSPADTILKRCDEVMEQHSAFFTDLPDDEGGPLQWCEACDVEAPCDAALAVHDLRDAVEALKEIKDEQGHVCPEFELCDHPACTSSYSSWAIADNALTDIVERGEARE